MRAALLCCVAFAFASAVTAAPVPKAKKQSDAELLDGRWACVSLNGRPNTEYWLEVKDGKLSTGVGRTNGYQSRAIKLDPDASPKHLDIDDLNGRFHLSIYEIDGDTLTWCETDSTTNRPTDLKGVGHGNLFVFKRDTSEKK